MRKTNAEYLKAYRKHQAERGLIRCDVWVPAKVADEICSLYGSRHPGHFIGKILAKHFQEISGAIKSTSNTPEMGRRG